MTENSNNIKMLRIAQVCNKVAYKESTVYSWMNPESPRYKPHFPLPKKNGRSNRWLESEIDDFCAVEFGLKANSIKIDQPSVTEIASRESVNSDNNSKGLELEKKISFMPEEKTGQLQTDIEKEEENNNSQKEAINAEPDPEYIIETSQRQYTMPNGAVRLVTVVREKRVGIKPKVPIEVRKKRKNHISGK